jgi:SAM-dependent methyltransferase
LEYISQILAFFKKFIVLRKIKNTFFVLPIKLSIKGVILGTAKILRYDSSIWTSESHYKVDYYTKLDDSAIRLLEEVKRNTHNDEKILDICCNIGRHINYLVENGYNNLYGFDIMKPAIDKMGDVFPNIDKSKIENCNIDEYFESKEDGYFDYAYTHTATLELIHPSFNIGQILNKKVKRGFTFYISEDGHSYPRYWRYIFRLNGFHLMKEEKIDNATILTFLRS